MREDVKVYIPNEAFDLIIPSLKGNVSLIKCKLLELLNKFGVFIKVPGVSL